MTDDRPDERLQAAYAAGLAAAAAGEEAAPGCTTTPAGRAWLRGYVDGARGATAARATPSGGEPAPP